MLLRDVFHTPFAWAAMTCLRARLQEKMGYLSRKMEAELGVRCYSPANGAHCVMLPATVVHVTALLPRSRCASHCVALLSLLSHLVSHLILLPFFASIH